VARVIITVAGSLTGAALNPAYWRLEARGAALLGQLYREVTMMLVLLLLVRWYAGADAHSPAHTPFQLGP